MHPTDHDVVLLVDDDPVSRLLTASVLAQKGMRIVEAGSGQEALDKFSQQAFDCVLLDALMPGMDGFDVCRAIRLQPNGAHIPILMLTGLDDEKSIAFAYEAGATDFFVKSNQWTLLAQRTRYLLRASRMRQELEESRAKLARAQKIARLGNWEIDLRTGKVTACEISMGIARAGTTSGVVDKGTFFEHVVSEDKQALERSLARLAHDGGELAIELSLGRNADDLSFVQLEAQAQRSESGAIDVIAGTIQDISQRKRIEEQILSLANYDSLTGLPNRRLFQVAFEDAVAEAEQSVGKLAALFVDLDRFKHVNDTQGHGAGDMLLREVAERLSQCVRWRDGNRDIVARLGGDEFVVLLTNITDEKQSMQVAERMLESLRAPFLINGQETFVSASIGIAQYPQDGVDPDELLRNADAAMYSAKAQGRNDLCAYTPEMQTTDRQRWELEQALNKALERNELELHYQIQIDGMSGKIVGAEALMRWKHEGKPVPPSVFIPIAEESGLIVPFGEWALRQAASDAASWIADGLPPIRVAVNIPGSHFQKPGFVEMIEDVLHATNLPAHLLELEITESMLMKDLATTIVSLQRLKRLGVRLAIDDFGTGYSSFAYLKKFDIHQLKIDRSFVSDINDNHDNEIITAAIIAMARTLKLEVVAEGVETDAQLALLRTHGCQTMQGYLFSKPVPDALFRALLRQSGSDTVRPDGAPASLPPEGSATTDGPNLRVPATACHARKLNKLSLARRANVS